MQINTIKKTLNLRGYCLLKLNFTKVSHLISFGKKFGSLKKVDYLRTHKKSKFINVVKRDKKPRKEYFGDIWHSDHGYSKNFPKYTIVFLKYVDRNPASTYILNRIDICNDFDRNEKNFLLNNKFELAPPIKQINNLKKKKLLTEKKKVNGLIKYKKKYKLEISPYHIRKKNKVLKKIFKKLDIKKNYDQIKLKKNDIIIWDNRLVFHKAQKISQKRIIYRMLIK